VVIRGRSDDVLLAAATDNDDLDVGHERSKLNC